MIFLLYNVSVQNSYKETLSKNGVLAFVPKGNSMWPFIKNGKQSVIIKPITEPLKKYDVCFYERADGAFVLHRVIDFFDGGYIVVGDSQMTKEEVKFNQLFGVMTGFYKGKKFIEVNDEKYLSAVEKWYSNSKKREKKIKNYYFWQRVKNKIFGKKNTEEQ